MTSLKQIVDCWNRFWFAPASPAPICLYRIFYGMLVAAYALFCMPDAWVWFGRNGVISEAVVRAWEGAPRFSLLFLFQPADSTMLACLGLLALMAVCLSLGLFSRLSSIAVWVLLVSFHHRDPFVINVGDHFLRVAGFLLMFAPCGEMYSLDAIFQSRRKQAAGEETAPKVLYEPWMLRLLQLEIAAVYCQSFWSKMLGSPWWTGTASYYATHVAAFAHLPLPVDALWAYQVISYATLVVEFSMWTLVWVKELRYWVLLAALCMHFGMELFMTLPMLVYVFSSALILFVEPEDLQRTLSMVRGFLSDRRKSETYA